MNIAYEDRYLPVNEITSKDFVRQLCRIGIVNILYRRLNLNKSEFYEKIHKGFPYVIHNGQDNSDIIEMYNMWMIGVMDAIEKNNLRGVYVYFTKKTTGKVVEYYRFDLRYEIGVCTKYRNLQVQKLFEFLYQLKDVPKFSDNIEPQMELLTEVVNVADLPPNFKGSNETLSQKLPRSGGRLFLKIHTGYHNFEAMAFGTAEVALRAIEEDLARQIHYFDNNMIVQLDESTTTRIKICEEDVNILVIPEDISILTHSTLDLEKSLEIEDSEECCTVNDPSFEIGTFQCSKCKKYLHRYCNGYFGEVPPEFQCSNCNPENDLLMYISRDKHPKFRKMRIVLGLCLKNDKFPMDLFKTFPKEEQEFIFRMLNTMGVLTDESTIENCKAIKENLKRLMHLLFADANNFN